MEKPDTDNEIDISTALTSHHLEPQAEWESEEDEKFISKKVQAVNRKKKKSGGFQTMGLSYPVYKAIFHKGYKVPTPIQRKTIPLIIDGSDVVGMARTGSGKTAAFLIPMFEKLKTHSAKFGARAIILSPSRELALQTQKVCKELGKYTDLRSCILVGGDSLDEQFAMIASNPDILIATPGRLLHLIVEMELELLTVEYVVFDEADRLFEMGFSVQLHEILHRLPASRQTLLFSATLPKTLADFAKAGLQDPTLIRLDVDSKISQDLEMAFFTVKQTEKEAGLLFILSEVIKVPLSKNAPSSSGSTEGKPKDKKKNQTLNQMLPHQTIIFVSTKHHVEYIGNLLSEAGYQTSYIYGSLDQSARQIQINNFREGQTNILIVTDVAARGIDIPILENVINYDFVDSSKIFVHRVGRTARAGRPGWAYSLLTSEELPYLLDLQLFLGRPLKIQYDPASPPNYSSDIVVGRFPQDSIDSNLEWVKSKLYEGSNLQILQNVAKNGYKLYSKSRTSAAPESYTRAKKELAGEISGNVHPLFAKHVDCREKDRLNFINSISNFRPNETIFEIGNRGNKKASEAGQIMKKRRERKAIAAYKSDGKRPNQNSSTLSHQLNDLSKNALDFMLDDNIIDSMSSVTRKRKDESESKAKKRRKENYRDDEHYIPHYQTDANTEKGYSMTQGSSFAQQAQKAILDPKGDERSTILSKKNTLRWDARKKNFVRGLGTGSDNKKLIKSESGAKLPATYKSGRFKDWQHQNKLEIPRTGERENGTTQVINKKFRHNKVTPPNPLAKDCLKKSTKTQKNIREKETPNYNSSHPTKNQISGPLKSELKTPDEISKQRKIKQKRRAKNARPRGSNYQLQAKAILDSFANKNSADHPSVSSASASSLSCLFPIVVNFPQARKINEFFEITAILRLAERPPSQLILLNISLFWQQHQIVIPREKPCKSKYELYNTLCVKKALHIWTTSPTSNIESNTAVGSFCAWSYQEHVQRTLRARGTLEFTDPITPETQCCQVGFKRKIQRKRIYDLRILQTPPPGTGLGIARHFYPSGARENPRESIILVPVVLIAAAVLQGEQPLVDRTMYIGAAFRFTVIGGSGKLSFSECFQKCSSRQAYPIWQFPEARLLCRWRGIRFSHEDPGSPPKGAKGSKNVKLKCDICRNAGKEKTMV
ncbi:hypothetical protein G9A89_014654 [Geosiphon pyriformis]|nr:hypothetical protein G9A89_014654 [Geosiphon pyriformis]